MEDIINLLDIPGKTRSNQNIAQLQKILNKVPFFQNLTKQGYHELTRQIYKSLKCEKYSPESLIQKKDQKLSGIYLLIRGNLGKYNDDFNIIDLFKPGFVFGTVLPKDQVQSPRKQY